MHLHGAVVKQNIPRAVDVGVAVENYVAVLEDARRREIAVGHDVDRSVAAIPKGLGIVAGLVQRPGVFVGGAVRAVDEDHVMAEHILERPAAPWILDRRLRLRADRPLAARSLQPNHRRGLYGPRDLLECLSINRHAHIAARCDPLQIEPQPQDIQRRAGERALLPIAMQIDGTELQRMNLRDDCGPMRLRGNARIRGDELQMVDLIILGNSMILQKPNQRRPIDAAIAPPMPRAGLLVIGEVRMKLRQMFAHHAGLLDGHVVVLIAVQNVNAMVKIVA